ncbi:MAG: FHA domain-containing protein [Anaerolineae bacterium]
MEAGDILLFLMRLVSAVILLASLGAVLWFLWRDLHAVAVPTPPRPANLGRLEVLALIDGELRGTGTGFDLRPVTRIGRGLINTVQIDDTFVSSDHALLTLRDGRWWLEDQNSRNGTVLNGLPISQPTLVTDGDIIEIGSRAFRLDLAH